MVKKSRVLKPLLIPKIVFTDIFMDLMVGDQNTGNKLFTMVLVNILYKYDLFGLHHTHLHLPQLAKSSWMTFLSYMEFLLPLYQIMVSHSPTNVGKSCLNFRVPS
jgi:hypothetical protein